MKSIELLGPFLGKVVVDITEHLETDPTKKNNTYVMLLFDDDTWIKFPQYDERYWYNNGD